MKSLIFVPAVAVMMMGNATNAAETEADTAGTYAVYGNWCGPSHPVDTTKAPPPIDNLDASCMRHDLCYETKGTLNCDCDADLVGEIRADLDNKAYLRPQLKYARNIHNYFQASPCDGDAKKKLLPSRILHRVYDKAKTKVTTVMEKFAGDEAKADTGAVENQPSEDTQETPDVLQDQ